MGCRAPTSASTTPWRGSRPKSFDVIVTDPPFHSGPYVRSRFVAGPASHLRPGGRVFLVARRSAGYARAMNATFGNVNQVAQEGGYTILASTAEP